ncbi:hypothetical protein D3C73_1197810 [compost metagenome]
MTKAASATAQTITMVRRRTSFTPSAEELLSPKSSRDSGRMSTAQMMETTASFQISDTGMTQLCCASEPAPQMNRLARYFWFR